MPWAHIDIPFRDGVDSCPSGFDFLSFGAVPNSRFLIEGRTEFVRSKNPTARSPRGFRNRAEQAGTNEEAGSLAFTSVLLQLIFLVDWTIASG